MAPSTVGTKINTSGLIAESELDRRNCRRRLKVALALALALPVPLLGIGLLIRWSVPLASSMTASDPFQFIMCNDNEPCCNGLPELCDVPVNKIMFAGVHNGMSSSEGGFLAPNHRRRLGGALGAGYRAFFLDVCYCGDYDRGRIAFCHSVCGVGTMEVEEVFDELSSFLMSHTSEVIILEFEMHKAMPDPGWLFMIRDLMEPSGLLDMLYPHHGGYWSDWPLLRDLVDQNRRLIIMHHNGPWCFPPPPRSIPRPLICPPGFLNYHVYSFETPYGLKGAKEVLDYEQSCQHAAGHKGTQGFFIMNHFAKDFFDLPYWGIARQLNGEEILSERIAYCSVVQGERPNIVSVDFWSIGDLPRVTQTQNRMIARERLISSRGA